MDFNLKYMTKLVEIMLQVYCILLQSIIYRWRPMKSIFFERKLFSFSVSDENQLQ